MGFKGELGLVTLCHEKGRPFLGIYYVETTQLCPRKRPFSTSNPRLLLNPGEKSGLVTRAILCAISRKYLGLRPPNIVDCSKQAQPRSDPQRSKFGQHLAKIAKQVSLPTFLASEGNARTFVEIGH
jgi:hypothetical protein